MNFGKAEKFRFVSIILQIQHIYTLYTDYWGLLNIFTPLPSEGQLFNFWFDSVKW